MLDQITPVILTLNEEPNIGRCLERLTWAKQVLVIDSLSTDATARIAGTFPNTRVIEHPFENHAAQWNLALSQAATEWVLALDADYIVPPQLIDEIAALSPDSTMNGYTTGFRYVVLGRPLQASLYPRAPVLFRREQGVYKQDGHTQRLALNGPVGALMSLIDHDDRKPFSRWLENQLRYMELEAEKIAATPSVNLSAADQIRKWMFISPFAVLVYTLLFQGAILDGRAGLYYSFQRMVAETILSLLLVERSLSGESR